MIKLFIIAIKENINDIIVAIHLCFVSVCVYLGEAGLVVQYAEDAMWPGADELQTGVEILKWHGIPLDLFITVFLLQDTHTNTHQHFTNKPRVDC